MNANFVSSDLNVQLCKDGIKLEVQRTIAVLLYHFAYFEAKGHARTTDLPYFMFEF